MRNLLIVATLLLGGCETFGASSKGIGFGSGEDDYKESPCACVEIKQKYKKLYKG